MSAYSQITLPASMNQRQFWLIHQMNPEVSSYNIPSIIELEGKLDPNALDQSLNDIIKQHAIFRTRFQFGSEGLQQFIGAPEKIVLERHQIHDLPEDLLSGKKHHILKNLVQAPFDLYNGPLIRCALLQLREDQYIFCLVQHHIITDLRSKQLLFAELSARYNASICGEEFSCSCSYQYSSYALRQLAWLTSEKAIGMRNYWCDQLKTSEEVLPLPLDFVRPAQQRFQGSIIPFAIDEQAVSVLRAYSRESLVDLYVTLLAAFIVLLNRYCRQNTIVLGVPLTNRRHTEDKDVLGPFVNIVPITFDLESCDTFSEALKMVRIKMLEAHRHQETPFETIVEQVNPSRDKSYNPIFQAGFTVEPDILPELTGIKATPYFMHNGGAQLDLFLNIKTMASTVAGYFEYDTSLFTVLTIERLRDSYLEILSSLPLSAKGPLSVVPVLSPRERQLLLEEFNRTRMPLPVVPLHQLIERVASNKGENPAVCSGEVTLSYKVLNAYANRLARLLASLTVGTGKIVGIYLDRSWEMLAAVYAVLKTGGAYLPLDIYFPSQRITMMLEDACPEVIITTSELVDSLPVKEATIVCLDQDAERILSFSEDNLDLTVSWENLAYVLFTSGSTGRPKGVQVSHQSVVNFLLSMQKEPGMQENDVLLAVTTLSFDISVLELFLPLITGASVVIASRATACNGEQLYTQIVEKGITVIQATPTTYHLLLQAGWQSFLPIKVLCGGEPFPQELAVSLTKLSSSVWNMYGPTETTVWSTCHRIEPNTQHVLVGRPIANTQIFILDEQLQPVPIGVAGEIYIGGLGVSKGYLHRADLTEERFIRHALPGFSQQILYRTGDLGCYLPDGTIKHLGRIDNQVKIRGFRIELEDIETAIGRHPLVHQVAVKPHEFAPGDIRLCAYVTLSRGNCLSDLRAFLKELLPEYMIPAIVTVLSSMPLTPNNKIDRKALPAPDLTSDGSSKKRMPPANEMEQFLAERWAIILQRAEIGVDESFFDLGGNSLLSVQLVTLLEGELKKTIPIVKFYQYPTVRAFARFLSGQISQKMGRNSPRYRAEKQWQALDKLRKKYGRKAAVH